MDLPENVDVVLMGTGLCEAMAAAALARVGKTVLHLDRKSYYGSHWATFSFEAINKWAQCQSEQVVIPRDGEDEIPRFDNTYLNICIKSYVPEKIVEEPAEEKTIETSPDFSIAANTENLDEGNGTSSNNSVESVDKESLVSTEENECKYKAEENTETCPIVKEKPKPLSPSLVSQAKINKGENISLEDFEICSRKFNLDITFKFLFSAGPLVDTIVKANISHYAEFKVINRMLMFRNSEIVEVPCNRADVFTSSFLSVIEKRTLMKFLTFCMEGELNNEDQEKSFVDLLISHRLSESLREFIIYSIAMVKPDTPAPLALGETKKFLMSLGKFGKSPFIWPLFGVAELPQAFCRMSAVFAGLYCLNCEPDELVIENGKCVGVRVNDRTINCTNVVMSDTYLPEKYKTSGAEDSISRAILITNKSVLASEEESLTFMTIPPLPNKEHLVQVFELGPASSACPSGLYVIYLACRQTRTAQDDLKEYVEYLVGAPDKPQLYWSMFFNQTGSVVTGSNLPENVHVTSKPGLDLGFHKTVEQAESIFNKIAPNEEFMMKVPNPEDIIWDDLKDSEDTVVNSVVSLEETADVIKKTDKSTNDTVKEESNVNLQENSTE